MLFFVASALAASGQVGLPCNRLNWAWRNVWVTCSIAAWAPGATPLAPLGATGVYPNIGNVVAGSYYSAGFTQVNPSTGSLASNPNYQNNPGAGYFGSQLDVNGQFLPISTGNVNGGGGTLGTSSLQTAPLLCSTSPNTGGAVGSSFLRNRCRRMLDTYGSLIRLCQHVAPNSAAAFGGGLGPSANPYGYVGPSANSVNPDFLPQSGHQPHVVNMQNLAYMAQLCLTPAGVPTPTNTCPGLQGWFTVVWNACQFTNAPNVGPNVINGAASGAAALNVPLLLNPNSAPNYAAPNMAPALPANAPNGGAVVMASTPYAGGTPNLYYLTTPQYLCGTTPSTLSGVTTPALNPPSGANGAPSAWNNKGPQFRSSRCRKALDQFGRTASRCAPSATPMGPAGWGVNDPNRFLAGSFGVLSPYCSV